jgi:hypothetical protein
MHHLLSPVRVVLEDTHFAARNHEQPLGPFSRKEQYLACLEAKFHGFLSDLREFRLA